MVKSYSIMPAKKLEQFHQENSTWIRILDFMEQETSFMKTRLSKALDLLNSSDLIEWAENFQTQVLHKEAAIDLLKQDIQSQEKRLASEYLFEGNHLKDEVVKSQSQLRLQMNYVENDFNSMRKEFNEFLALKLLQ
jgi:hypothetical protein